MDVGETLLRKGLIDARQLELARAAQTEGQRLDQAAVQLGFLTEEAALQALAAEVGLDFVDLVDAEIDLTLLKDFPSRFIHREALFPIRRENGTLVVATSDPFNLYPIDELSVATGLTVVPVLASREEILKRIKTHLGVGSETIDGLMAQSDDRIDLAELSQDDAELSEQAQEPSVVRLVNEILLEAIELRASDVHLESQQSGLRVRYRIDGVLHAQSMPPEIHRFQAAIISRLKIMSRLNIAERRLPQDGRIQLRTGGREVDIRVSVIPMIHGEGIVLRLLDKGAMEFSLSKLGMEDDL
jgi:type II secretory ATPase GspE/PulE/Tfp pilus assembly ATPase PilB-like protein